MCKLRLSFFVLLKNVFKVFCTAGSNFNKLWLGISADIVAKRISHLHERLACLGARAHDAEAALLVRDSAGGSMPKGERCHMLGDTFTVLA